MNFMLRNWSTDELKIRGKGKRAFAIWKLEQMVNFGLVGNQKINTAELKKYWPYLNLDPDRKSALEFLLKN